MSPGKGGRCPSSSSFPCFILSWRNTDWGPVSPENSTQTRAESCDEPTGRPRTGDGTAILSPEHPSDKLLTEGFLLVDLDDSDDAVFAARMAREDHFARETLHGGLLEMPLDLNLNCKHFYKQGLQVKMQPINRDEQVEFEKEKASEIRN